MSDIDLIPAADPATIAEWLAGRIGRALAAGEGPVAIAVPGGSTPFPIMEKLALADLDWRRLVIWPGDDRAVPADHEASNEGRIRAIFAPVGAEVARLTVMEQVPVFALAWLGMGTDGHVASLFPSTDPRTDTAERVVRLTPDPLPPEAPFDRISLTLPALLTSGEIVFTLGGNAEKRALFEAAMRGENDLPVARLLAAADQPVTCFA